MSARPTDWHVKPPSKVRSVQDALASAERRRNDLPHVVQVYAADWDEVILADHIATLESEVAALRAEVEGMREDAALMQAAKYACEHLPEWCEVTLFMERGAGWISWSDEHGNEYDVEPNDDSLAKQIIRSVDAARKESSNG